MTGAGALFAGFVMAAMAVANGGCGDSASSSGGYAYAGSSGGGSSSSGAGATQQPDLAIVQTDQTMTASPGQGVGVFVQYQAGGHWNVWWTCDTYKTSLNCNFDVNVTVQAGTIDNLAGQGAASYTAAQVNAAQIEATTTTSTGVDGMTFDTPVGQSLPVITVGASVDGSYSGSFMFFVQDGQINGGYTGMLSDPLSFQPTAP
jgi:hypothetical protein